MFYLGFGVIQNQAKTCALHIFQAPGVQRIFLQSFSNLKKWENLFRLVISGQNNT